MNYQLIIYNREIKKNNNYLKTLHSWHIIDPSPWPLITAFGAFVITLSFGLYMHNYYNGGYLCICGFIILFYSTYMWWRDVVREATLEEQHTYIVQRSLRFGMILFIVSEIMFFFAFFWAFFHSSLSPTFNIGGIWPPESIDLFATSGIPLTNTIFLLSSGITVTWSHHAIINCSKQQAILGLFFTLFLAILFTLMQVFEYFEAPFSISDSVYGSCFFMTTGFHGFHVIIGTCFLSVSLIRLLLSHLTKSHHFSFEAGAWYWHFVDVVWLFLFIMVYWWGGN
jgi:cytochrome c oxidase subunit 3